MMTATTKGEAMAELILDATGREDALCSVPHPMGGDRLQCCREPGHGGCHWAPMFASAERFIIWHPGTGVAVAKAIVHRQQLLRLAAGQLPAPGASTWPWPT
jgi:hypothetical protein